MSEREIATNAMGDTTAKRNKRRENSGRVDGKTMVDYDAPFLIKI